MSLSLSDLDDLPVGARVVDAIGDAYLKLPDGTWDTPFDDTPIVLSATLISWGPIEHKETS